MTKRFSNDKKDKSFEGKYYRAPFNPNELRLHSRNIRNYEPIEKIIDSMREFGFVKERPLILALENGIPSIVNGNQRNKAAIIVGLTEVDCIVFYDINDAIKFATIDNIQRKWTPYQKYKNAINYYKSLIHKGYNNLKAFNMTMKDLSIKKYMLSDYISISKLPNIVKALIKKPDNRKKEEKAIIERIDINNKLKGRVNKLKPELAGYMGKYLVGIGIKVDVMCKIGIELISEKLKDAKIIIEAIVENYLEQTPSETIRFYKTGSPHKQIQFTENYEPKKYNEIVKRFVSLGMNAKLYISALIEEDLKTIRERIPNDGDYIISVKGNVIAGFSFDEVIHKAWNKTRLPKDVKKFLDHIEFVDGGIYLKCDNYEIRIFKF